MIVLYKRSADYKNIIVNKRRLYLLIPRNMTIVYEFVGTAHMDNGLVFHVFERLGI